jgi:alpha-galactosidase
VGNLPDLAPATPRPYVNGQTAWLLAPLHTGRLQRQRSLLGGGLVIAGTTYAHGLSVRTPNRFEVHSVVPMVRLEAVIGIDDAAPESHPVEFNVKPGRHWVVQRLYEGTVSERGQPGQRIAVELGGIPYITLQTRQPPGTRLETHGIWAEAVVTLADGSTLRLGDLAEQQELLPGPFGATGGVAVLDRFPLAMRLDGQPLAESFHSWQRLPDQFPSAAPGRATMVRRWRDPSGLEIAVEETFFPGHDASEWVVRLAQRGPGPSPLIEDLLPLDLELDVTGGDPVLACAVGSQCNALDFLPFDLRLTDGWRQTLAPVGGRPSNSVMPFFTLDGGDNGLVLAIGWSGQWRLGGNRQGDRLRLAAGQELTRFRMQPGEEVRTPGILMLAYEGDREQGENRFRRLMVDQYLPRRGGRVIPPPMTHNTWFVADNGSNVDEKTQLASVAAVARAGLEHYWLDAGWYGEDGKWATNVGSWIPRPDVFPNGLAPLGRAAHEAGIGFVLWFEPERLSPNCLIHRQHPEFVIGGEKGHCYNLGDPAARRYMTDLLSDFIATAGVDVLRIDHNLDPLDPWRSLDAPDRQGIGEMRCVEGLYLMWDELRQRHPHLVIDTCASGGQRIDIEVLRRSFPLWRSDTQCFPPAIPTLDQAQTAGLSRFVPLHAAGMWGVDPYTARSVATTGFSLCIDPADHVACPPAELAARMAEVRELRDCWLGDFHALTPITVDETRWMAWQLHRPDLGRGFAMAFRRPQAGNQKMWSLGLRDLDPHGLYCVRHHDAGWIREMTGAELASLLIDLPQRGSCALISYRACSAPIRQETGMFALHSPEIAGARKDAWTVETEDTRLTVGATHEGQLVVYELSNPSAGWNWTAEPSVVDLPRVAGTAEGLRWQFQEAVQDNRQGQKIILRFACPEPALELESVWWARPGRGPVQHSMRIVNRSGGAVSLSGQPSVHLHLMGHPAPTMWSFHADGYSPDRVGVYRKELRPPFHCLVQTHPDGRFIPYVVFDVGGQHGLYAGIEWGFCQLVAASQNEKPGMLNLRGGPLGADTINLAPGEAFAVPASLIGAYQGDVDDAGNGLRKYLFAYNTPDIVRKDPTYPKVQWNAFGATGDKPGGWNSVESKYYPMVEAIAPLGFEEVMLDVGWWEGGTKAPEPKPDPVDWPSGMAKAAEHAHKAGMRFGLYWNKGEAMASAEGRQRRMAHIRRLYEEHKADLWRSDSTGGPVVGASYAEVRGFYDMLDQLHRELPNFQWENCVCGGRLKDFGSMKRAVKIFLTDTYFEHHIRQAFYDSSFCYPAAQLEGCVGSTDGRFRPQGPVGMRFAFRSTSLGAVEWFIDAPTGLNSKVPWTDDERAAVKAAVATYKTRIRPLVRNADLYHILPRPDGKNWDGIQYHDPATGKGVIYLFKPSAVADTITLKLRGVEPGRRYRVTFEDGSNPTAEKTGAELAKGLEVTLKGAPVSELVWIEESNQ